MAASNDPISRGSTHGDTSSRAVPHARTVFWLAALIVGLVALHRLGATTLSPPDWSPSTWLAWWSANEPITAAMALVRVVALAIGWYLLVVTALTLLAGWSRAAAASRLLQAIAVPPLRDTVATIVGVAMVTATSAPASASTIQAHDVTTPVAVHLVSGEGPEDECGGVPSEPPVGEADEDASDALRRLREGAGRFVEDGGGRGRPSIGEVPPSVATQGEVLAPARQGEVVEPPPPGDHGPEGDAADDAPVHLVVAGESFWSIARDHLQAVGAPSDDVAIAAYWLVLIDANRDRLVVANEPDLILPGQRLTLPEVATPLTAEAGS